MSKPEYWIWLSMALGAGAVVDEVLCAYPDPEMLYKSDRLSRNLSGIFSKAKLDRLESVDADDARNALRVAQNNGWKVIVPDSEDYPPDLQTLANRPLVLYADGDLSCLKNRMAIGVVGTREPTYDSVDIAKKLSADLCASGAVVVSGGALGIDTAAHEGALSAGGPTVCVLGCGLGTRYLMENDYLRRQIAGNGAVISEYTPLSSASRVSFPIRNRIISGLSKGILVVEAGEKSGSLITASCAAEQGRDVFAVPGSILVSSYSGVNHLIRDGAKAVTCAEDILAPYRAMYPDLLGKKESRLKMPSPAARKGDKKINRKKTVPPGLGAEAEAVYKAMGADPVYSDELCEQTNMPASKVMAALIELELGGLVEKTDGKMWICS